MIILYILMGLIALFFIGALIAPRKYSVIVSETMNVPRQKVFDYLRHLKNMEQYNEWIKADPAMSLTITGTDGEAGAVQKWVSNNKNVGEGEQEIKSVSQDRIVLELRFKRPMEGTSEVENVLESLGNMQTRLTYNFHTYAKFPMNLPSYVIGRQYITKVQKKNLRNIKSILESR